MLNGIKNTDSQAMDEDEDAKVVLLTHLGS